MKAFIPYDMTDAMLLSSSIAEPYTGEPIWLSTTTYAEGAQVSLVSANKHDLYESLIAGNLNNNPATTNTDVVPVADAKWIRVSNTNRWRMFDWFQGTPSRAESPITVVLRPGKRISAIGIEGLQAKELSLTVTNGVGGPIVYTLDGDLSSRRAVTPYEWFFSPFMYQKVVSTFNIPPATDPVITLTLTNPDGFVELGRFAMGQSIYIGPIEWDPVSDSDNYSDIAWDKFGKATLTPSASIPLTEQKILVKQNRVNIVRQFRDQANAKAVFWSALDDVDIGYTESLVLFGVYRNFQISPSNQEEAIVNLSIKGV